MDLIKIQYHNICPVNVDNNFKLTMEETEIDTCQYLGKDDLR